MRCTLGPLALSLAIVSVAAAQEEHSEIGLYLPESIEWQPGPPSIPPGAKVAMLEGDLAKDGPFVMRVKLPDGYRIGMHTHPKPERVTVLSGVFNIVMGDNQIARKLTAGAYGSWPAGMKHSVWTEGETIFQIHGTGRWSIEYVNPGDDPRSHRSVR